MRYAVCSAFTTRKATGNSGSMVDGDLWNLFFRDITRKVLAVQLCVCRSLLAWPWLRLTYRIDFWSLQMTLDTYDMKERPVPITWLVVIENTLWFVGTCLFCDQHKSTCSLSVPSSSPDISVSKMSYMMTTHQKSQFVFLAATASLCFRGFIRIE